MKNFHSCWKCLQTQSQAFQYLKRLMCSSQDKVWHISRGKSGHTLASKPSSFRCHCTSITNLICVMQRLLSFCVVLRCGFQLIYSWQVQISLSYLQHNTALHEMHLQYCRSFWGMIALTWKKTLDRMQTQKTRHGTSSDSCLIMTLCSSNLYQSAARICIKAHNGQIICLRLCFIHHMSIYGLRHTYVFYVQWLRSIQSPTLVCQKGNRSSDLIMLCCMPTKTAAQIQFMISLRVQFTGKEG